MTSKASAILDQAQQALIWLCSLSSSLSSDNPSPFPDLDLCLQSLPLSRRDISSEDTTALHSIGVKLWNACCEVDRDAVGADIRANAAKVRALAYFLHVSGVDWKAQKPAVQVKAFQIGCRAARECLGTAVDNILLATKLIEHVAELHSLVKSSGNNADDQVSWSDDMQVAFLLLRIIHAWKQGRLDLADHFYGNISNADYQHHSQHGYAADLCYEIGVEQLGKDQHRSSVTWLRRAKEQIENVQDESDIDDPEELRLTILHQLVLSLLAIKDPASTMQAQDLFKSLKQDYGQKLPVLLLEIELMTQDASPCADTYATVLANIIHTVFISEANHKLIMYHIHQLKAISCQRAYETQKLYILQRLIQDEPAERIEAAIIVLIWIALEQHATIRHLAEDLATIQRTRAIEMDSEGANAAVLLFWRFIDSANEQPSDGITAVLCRAALNPLFAAVGVRNRAKLQRRLVLALVNTGNLDEAQSILKKIVEPAEANPLSMYLNYLIALRRGDNVAADATGNALLSCPKVDLQLLLACAGETMKHGSQHRGAQFLQRPLDKSDCNLPPGVDTGALLRCTARLHLSVLEQDIDGDSQVLLMLCSVFRAAATWSNRCSGEGAHGLSYDECEWFEKTAFNAALEHVNEWPARIIIDLLEHSMGFQYPDAVSPATDEGRLQHQGNATFLQAAMYATTARNWTPDNTIEDLPRTSYHARDLPMLNKLRYHLYQHVIQRYHKLAAIERSTQHSLDEIHESHRSQAASVLMLAFEAQVFHCISDKEDGLPFTEIALAQLIDDIPRLAPSPKEFACVADSILSATLPRQPDSSTGNLPGRLPFQAAINLLAKLLALIRNEKDYDLNQAARWIRCIVQLVLDAQHPIVGPSIAASEAPPTVNESSLSLLEPLVTEAVSLAQSAASLTEQRLQIGQQEDTLPRLYPSDELQWLASTLFNLAVDLHFTAGSQVLAEKWAGIAVKVAEALNFGAGTLRDMDTDFDNGIVTENGNGNGGSGLAKMLKERCIKAGWTI